MTKYFIYSAVFSALFLLFVFQQCESSEVFHVEKPHFLYSSIQSCGNAHSYDKEKREPPRPWTDVPLPLLMSMVNSKQVKLFDVRTVEEIEETGMIPGATNIPLSDVGDAFALSEDDFQSQYGVKKPSQNDSTIVINCLAGYRSLEAMDTLHTAGYYYARHYPGGWEEYEQYREETDLSKLKPWTDVTYEELMSMIKSKDIQLFDVRRVEEVESTGLIPGATNIPITEMEKAFSMFPNEFKEAYGVDMPSKDDKNVVLYSLNGFRSLASLAVLGEDGFNKFRQYPGGWAEYHRLSNQ